MAAVLAVVEETLSPGQVELRLVNDQAARRGAVEGRGVMLYSFMTAHSRGVAGEIRRLRQVHGDALRMVAGGPHATGAPGRTLEMGFHHVVVGEAAGAGFRELLQALSVGVSVPPGLVPSGRRLSLDPQRAWPHSVSLFCPIELTRGCPLGCAYCQIPVLHGRRPRHRTLAAIERLVIQAVKTGHTFTRFVSSNALAWGAKDGLTPDPARLVALFEMLRRRGFQRVFFGNFPSEVRPESVSPDVLKVLRDHVDNRSLVVGMQSGSDAMLRRLGRGHTVEEGVRAVDCIAAAGFIPAVDFIFGLPGESETDRRATRHLMRHLVERFGARINNHVFTPLPGTPLAGEPEGVVDHRTRKLAKELIGRGHAWGHDVG